jgi:phage terminase large subunit
MIAQQSQARQVTKQLSAQPRAADRSTGSAAGSRALSAPALGLSRGGGTRAIEIAHRRWGKDDVTLHWSAVAHSASARTGTCCRSTRRARKAIWNAVNPHTGRRRIDEAFPKELRAATNADEMFIRFKCGSTWQVIGSDNYDKLVGTPPVGRGASEWSRANPRHGPIWRRSWPRTAAGRPSSPRRSAATTPSRCYDMAKTDPAWFAEVSTVEDTKAIPLSVIEGQRREYHAIYGEEAGDALIEQEYWCSFSAAVLGSYWGKEINRAEREDRVCEVNIDRKRPLYCAWDIGVDDPMALWLYQLAPRRIDVIDYYESSGFGFDHYVDWLKERDYNATHWVPHDAKMREVGAPGARTRIETLMLLLKQAGHSGDVRLVPAHKVADGINAARRTIPLARFDAEALRQGPRLPARIQGRVGQRQPRFPQEPAAQLGFSRRRQLAPPFGRLVGAEREA